MPANADNTSYSITGTTLGWREPSLMGKIITISPEDYVVFSHTGNTRAKDTQHYWQTRLLPTRDFDASNGGANITQIEGATYSYSTVTEPSRPGNTTQIFWVGAEVSGTAEAISYYGIAKLLADQVDYRSRQWKGGVERALVRAVETTGNTETARRMDGLLAAITTNASTNGNATLTETQYIEQLKAVWDNGPKARHVLTNGSLRLTIDKFDAQGATKWIQTTAKEVVNMVLIYQSTFGTVQNMLSRDLEDGNGTAELIAIDFSNFKKAWLRPVRMTKPAIDGDYLRTIVLGELTLEYADERAASKLTAIATGVI